MDLNSVSGDIHSGNTIRIDAASGVQSQNTLINFIMSNNGEAALCCNWDQNGFVPIIAVNKLTNNLLGYNSEELIKKNLYDIFAPESLNVAQTNLRTFPGEIKDSWDGILITKNGEKLNAEIIHNIFITEGGKQFLVLLIDSLNTGFVIQKNFKKLLEKTETICQLGYWEYDLCSGMLWGSPGMRSIFGINKTFLSVDDVKQLQISEDVSEIKKMRNGLTIDKKFEVEFEIPESEYSSLSYYKSVAEYDALENKIFGVIRNINERKDLENEFLRLKEKSEKSDRLKDSFFSNMSHEIRTPMNSIVGFSQLLLQSDLQENTRKNYAELIDTSCQQLLGLITDIIEISRVDSDLVSLEIAMINIPELLDGIVNSFKAKTSGKGLEIRLNPDTVKENMFVSSDEVKIRRIFSSLIDNSIKFTSSGYIEIGCVKRDCFFEFYVKDTGVGISPSDQALVFGRFSLLEDKNSQYYQGTGLGLAISKSYVSMLGGSIWFDSRPGEGSVFYFTIPESEQNESNIEDNFQEPIYRENGVKTCLIVDDIEVNYIYLEALLTSEGFKTIWARDGIEAIFKSINEPVDIVLMDMKMPNIDGYNATRIIKKEKPELPVIAQTACALLDEKNRALQAGCDDYIAKPIDKKVFLKKIRSLLKSDQAEFV